MVAVLVAFFFYQKNKQLEADLTAIKAKQSKVMVAADNYESGTVLTEESLVMQEVQTTKDDNQDLMIADYYKYFPKETPVTPAEGVWL
jgi:hypothetical protein